MSQDNNAEIKSEDVSEIKSEIKSEDQPKSKGQRIGSKYQVYEGIAKQTAGGLTKDDLMKNKRGQIISKKRHEQGHKAFENLKKHVLSKHARNDEESKEDQAGQSEDLSAVEEAKDEIKACYPEEPQTNEIVEASIEPSAAIEEVATAEPNRMPVPGNAISEPQVIKSSKRSKQVTPKKATKAK